MISIKKQKELRAQKFGQLSIKPKEILNFNISDKPHELLRFSKSTINLDDLTK